MKRYILIMIAVLITLSAVTFSVLADGSLSSPGDGLVKYYLGMSKSRVQAVAPRFEDYSDNLYLIDKRIIGSGNGLTINLLVNFEDNYVHAVCFFIDTDVDIFRSSASITEVAQITALSLKPYIGINFNWLNDCETDESGYTCATDRIICLYDDNFGGCMSLE